MHRIRSIGRCLVALSVVCAAFAAPPARAADYDFVASGPWQMGFSESKTFDGTSTGTLPPMLDFDRLQGGSFRATYRFADVRPAPGNNAEATYPFGPGYGVVSFELLDPAGNVVHRGTQPSNALVYVQNYDGSVPFRGDQVFLTSDTGDVSGADIPTPLYGTPNFLSASGLNFYGGTNALTDLSIPVDAAPYLAFDFRQFDVLMEFGDGDYVDRVDPYQFNSLQFTYDVSAVTVTAVPEPTAATALLAPALLLLRRRRAAR